MKLREVKGVIVTMCATWCQANL